MSVSATAAARFPARVRLRYYAVQNVPLLLAFGRLQPIVVTLATLAIWQGVALLVLPQPGGMIPATLSNVLSGTIPALANLPCGLVVLAVLILLWQVLRRTPFLSALYAI